MSPRPQLAPTGKGEAPQEPEQRPKGSRRAQAGTGDRANRAAAPPWGRHLLLALLAILALGAALRLVSPGQSPPGLHQDECAYAWGAWCLLHTGRDQTGDAWPVFYTRSIGDNRSTLYLYLLLPFQAVGGLNALTTRLPMILAGIATIPVMLLLGRRLFGDTVGLLAALLVALDPWHLQLSRTAFEAGLWMVAVPAVLVLMVRARLPLGQQPELERGGGGDRGAGPHPPRVAFAVAAGLLAGLACYGYPAGRPFMPLLLLACVLVNPRAWWRTLRARRGAAAIAGLALAFLVLFGPLAWRHLIDPAISKRGVSQLLWNRPDVDGPIGLRLLERYLDHYSPGFLWIEGSTYPVLHVQGWGQLHWYTFPLMAVGLGVVVRSARGSAAARVLLAWLLLYPVGDLVAWGPTSATGSHPLRSTPGVGALILLAAVGGAAIWRWLSSRGGARTARIAAGAAAAVVLSCNVMFWRDLYGSYDRDPEVYLRYFEDVKRACGVVRPRLDEVDAVFWTTTAMNQLPVITLVHLGYDPRRWLADVKDVRTPGEFDLYVRYGKSHFMYGSWFLPYLREIAQRERGARVLFVLRPGELVRELGLGEPLVTVLGPARTPTLCVYERVLRP